MITYKIWRTTYLKLFTTPIDYLFVLVGSIVAIPLDILLSPLEILAFIIYKIVEKE